MIFDEENQFLAETNAIYWLCGLFIGSIRYNSHSNEGSHVLFTQKLEIESWKLNAVLSKTCRITCNCYWLYEWQKAKSNHRIFGILKWVLLTARKVSQKKCTRKANWNISPNFTYSNFLSHFNGTFLFKKKIDKYIWANPSKLLTVKWRMPSIK